jgi:hypothetical protein
MLSRNKPACATCTFFSSDKAGAIGGAEMARLYTKAETDGGVCERASLPFRQPSTAVCGLYNGPALPRFAGPWARLRLVRSLAQETLDALARSRDDSAVLRCAVAGSWTRAIEARKRSHELWSFLRPALEARIFPEPEVWRDRFIRATTVTSRFLADLGNMSSFHAIREAGVEDLGIFMPERDTGMSCSRCGADLNSVLCNDLDGSVICRACAKQLGIVKEEEGA